MEVKPGLRGEATLKVSEKNTAKEMESGSLSILGTPALVALMEKAATNALEGNLSEGKTTVGIRIDIQHLAPTPIGMEVKAKAELISVDGQRLQFRLEAGDEKELIGRGEHFRVIVPGDGFLKRANEKKMKK